MVRYKQHITSFLPPDNLSELTVDRLGFLLLGLLVLFIVLILIGLFGLFSGVIVGLGLLRDDVGESAS